MASQIAVLSFDDQYGAGMLLEYIGELQDQGLIELEDAVIAFRGPGKNLDIQKTRFTGRGVGTRPERWSGRKTCLIWS